MFWQNVQVVGNGYPNQVCWNGNRPIYYPNQSVNFPYGFIPHIQSYPTIYNFQQNAMPARPIYELQPVMPQNINQSSRKHRQEAQQPNHQIVQQENDINLDQTKRIYCSCPKSRCIKEYCLCFKNGVDCGLACRCLSCKNTKTSKVIRPQIKKQAFCSCRKIGCRKKYCQCFGNGRKCTRQCQCYDCQNGCI